MADLRAAALPGAATGAAARALAARLAPHGYQVSFPPGRDPAVFKVTGLPGRPDVEVSAENDGSAACHYTGCTQVQAAKVIARLPAPGRSHVAVAGETATATWGGIEVEWHYQPPQEQPGDPDQMTAALLAHLAVLGGNHDRKDDPT
jgi:hypothetical protein